jgi:hypothetical protein
MSVIDVYRRVRDIGKSDPGSLVEMSVFAHGWMGGPVLVNSHDDGMIGRTGTVVAPGARDPDDKDPRFEKDFVDPHMSATDREGFRAAFGKRGIVWLWGCAMPQALHALLRSIETHRDYRESGLTDDTTLALNLNGERLEALTVLLSLVGKTLKADVGKRVDVRFGDVRAGLCRLTLGSYAQRIAVAANVVAYGALMGTYAEFDTGTLPLMTISKRPEVEAHRRLYANYLKMKFDPEGRGYGEHGSAVVTCLS